MRDARNLFAESFLSDAVTVAPVVIGLVLALLVASHWLGPIARAGLVLGVGLGGFADGIVLHQLLQWHGMFTSETPAADLASAKYNMIWDGMFHVITWVACVVGIVMLFRAGRRADALWSGRRLGGSMLAGWGLFNVVEGTLDHLVLGIHHVRPGPAQLAWDIGFVILGGVLLVVAGYFVARTRAHETGGTSRDEAFAVDASSTSP